VVLSPTTGRYHEVDESSKGRESIRVYGLNRTMLETARQQAWVVFESIIIRYGCALADNHVDLADRLASVARNLQFAGVFRTLIGVCSSPDAVHLVDHRCRAVVLAQPEVARWLD
jgi:hypothetical protein